MAILQAQIICENEYRDYYGNNMGYREEKIISIFTNYINTYKHDMLKYIQQPYNYLKSLLIYIDRNYFEIINFEKQMPYYVMQYLRQKDFDLPQNLFTNIPNQQDSNSQSTQSAFIQSPNFDNRKENNSQSVDSIEASRPSCSSTHLKDDPILQSLELSEKKGLKSPTSDIDLVRNISNQDFFESIAVSKTRSQTKMSDIENLIIINDSKLSEIYLSLKSKSYTLNKFKQVVLNEINHRYSKYKLNLIIEQEKPGYDKMFEYISACKNNPRDGDEIFYLVRKAAQAKEDSNSYKIGIVKSQTLEKRIKYYNTLTEYDKNGNKEGITKRELYGYWWCKNSKDIEDGIKEIFPIKFPRSEGKENFRGDVNEMEKTIDEYIKKNNN